MNLKNVLKNFDYKGFALQHCEKAVIALVTALLVMFLVNGFKKAISASDVTPQKIADLADNLNRSVVNSEWNESVAEREQIKNPDFKAEIAKLMSGISGNEFVLAQLFYKFVDFGGILRQRPEILKPYHPLALADKGAVSLYKVDANGEFIEKVIEVRTASRAKQDDEDAKKKKKSRTAAKAPSGRGGMMGSRGMSMMGGDDDMMMGAFGRQDGMGGREDTGLGATSGDVDGMDMDMGRMAQGNLGSSQQRRTASGLRREASKRMDEGMMFDDMDERRVVDATTDGKADSKVPQKRTIREEEIIGIRWAMITALFPHGEQVKKFTEALHTPDDPPDYEAVRVERREILSDGSFSEWAALDMKKEASLVKRFPERWEPEDPAVHAAKADFPGLMMRLPELEVGQWIRYVRREAHNSALDITGGAGQYAAGRRGGRGDSDEDLMSGEDDPDMYNADLFGSSRSMGDRGSTALTSAGVGAMGGRGGGMGPGNMGIAGSSGMMSGSRGSGNRLGGQTVGKAQQPVQQSKAEIVQIRFVDYTVEPEHTYQYRLKVVVKNPNYNRLDVINPDVATEKTLTSEEWSEPTPLVYVPPDTEYFVLDRVRGREEAKVQVHRWLADMGDWQLWDFPIKPGDPIGTRVRDYPLITWEEKQRKTEFDFSTQDLLLDVSGGDKPFVFEVDGSEITFTEKLPTEVFVVDRLGDLAVRTEDFDKHNVDRVDREAYVKTLREKAEKEDSKKSTTKTESGSRDDFDSRLPPTRRDDK